MRGCSSKSRESQLCKMKHPREFLSNTVFIIYNMVLYRTNIFKEYISYYAFFMTIKMYYPVKKNQIGQQLQYSYNFFPNRVSSVCIPLQNKLQNSQVFCFASCLFLLVLICSSFTMSCQFQSYNTMIQLYIYIIYVLSPSYIIYKYI